MKLLITFSFLFLIITLQMLISFIFAREFSIHGFRSDQGLETLISYFKYAGTISIVLFPTVTMLGIYLFEGTRNKNSSNLKNTTGSGNVI
jgi:hypothetical protein